MSRKVRSAVAGKRRPKASSSPVNPASAGPERAGFSFGRGCFLLTSLAFVLYARTWSNGFVDYDDLAFISLNPRVSSGISWENTWWALTSREHRNWMPAVRWSFQLDCTLWGANAAGMHHAVSAFLHGLAATALARAVFVLSGRAFLSLAVAAVFALHPLQVEAVAWAASRKHLLSAPGAFIALELWLRWMRGGRTLCLAGAFAAFVFSLLAKQTMTGWPVVMGLAVFLHGPVKRPPRQVWSALGIFGLLALAAAAMALWAGQAPDHTRLTTESKAETVLHAPLSVVKYARAFLFPVDLNYLHVMPERVSRAAVAGVFLLLAVLSFTAWKMRVRHPLILTGWAWFLFVYASASGLIPFGPQAWAERFGYGALPGLALALFAASPALRNRRILTASAFALWLTALAVLSVHQQGFWKDSQALFSRALAVDPDNPYARFHLACLLEKTGREPEAFIHYRHAAEHAPSFAPARYNYACALMRRKMYAEAFEAVQPVAETFPKWPEAQLVLGNSSYETGRFEGALAAWEAAAKLKPELHTARRNAGLLRSRLKDLDDPP